MPAAQAQSKNGGMLWHSQNKPACGCVADRMGHAIEIQPCRTARRAPPPLALTNTLITKPSKPVFTKETDKGRGYGV